MRNSRAFGIVGFLVVVVVVIVLIATATPLLKDIGTDDRFTGNDQSSTDLVANSENIVGNIGAALKGLKDSFLAEKNYVVVRVFYATDRNLTSSKEPKTMFGNERASLRYGTADVSIPRDHRLGELEEPSILRLEFKEDPDQHVVLMHVVVQDADAFFRGVKSKVAESGKRSAFIFVHGYHVSFEDATRRTAQMAYDLGFEGAPVLYSWPSQGTLAGYTIDESNAEWTQRNLEDFLLDFAERSGADDIHLISHSMGGRPLTRAVVALMQRHPELKRHFSELILTAPDIDAQVFARDIVPGLLQTGAPITLYASSEDNALAASKQVHGYPRAGDSGRGLVVMSGVETVDATGMDTGFLKHSYYAETRSVLSDMFYLIHNGERADQRFGLRGIDSPAGRYWVFKK